MLKAAFARNCILARRLVERGVRVVQIFNGSYHNGIERRLTDVEGYVIEGTPAWGRVVVGEPKLRSQ